MRPASAPIPSQLRTAVKLIMPLPAEASARKPMPTTAATGLRFKPRMAARNLLPIVLPNAKRLIPIIAETAMLSLRLTATSRFTATASQSAKCNFKYPEGNSWINKGFHNYICWGGNAPGFFNLMEQAHINDELPELQGHWA